MQPCNRIYYSKVYWRLNMFRAAHRSSSRALTLFAASGLYTHVVTSWSPHVYINQRLQIHFRAPDDLTRWDLSGEWPVAAHLLRTWVWIPPGAWIFVCCECRVLSGRGLCDELITHPEESYRLWCVVVCDLETSRMGAPHIYIYMTLVA